MSDSTYGPKVYRKQGGNEMVVANGGQLTIENGGVLDFDGIMTGLIRGLIVFVDSVNGDDSYDGLTWATAKATLDAAVGLCTANNGDYIYLSAAHAETLTAAAQCVLDVAGITVVGLGRGSAMPTITLGTATTTDVDIDADNITIRNVRFISAIDDLAVMIDVNEDYATFEGCEFVGPATTECLNFVNIATTKDNFVFRGCKWLQNADPTGTDGAAATGAIYVVDSENILVEDCIFDGFFETACLHNKTTALKYLTWRRNSVNQQLTITGRRLLLVAGTVGCSIGVDNDFVPGLGYKITKAEDVNTATSDDLFTIAGKVLITLWNMEVTNALGAQPTDYTITLTTLNGALVAAGNIASAAIGFMRNLNGDAGDTALSVSSGAVSVTGVADTNGKTGQMVVGKAGGTDIAKAVRTAGDASDAILHTVYYIPLEPAAYIVAAA